MTEPMPPDRPSGSPRGVQLMVLLVGGPLLAIGGCAAAVSGGTLERLMPFGAVFVLGVVLTVTGIAVVFMESVETWKEIAFVALVVAGVLSFVVFLLLGLFQG